jgi:hypothetical protein
LVTRLIVSIMHPRTQRTPWPQVFAGALAAVIAVFLVAAAGHSYLAQRGWISGGLVLTSACQDTGVAPDPFHCTGTFRADAGSLARPGMGLYEPQSYPAGARLPAVLAAPNAPFVSAPPALREFFVRSGTSLLLLALGVLLLRRPVRIWRRRHREVSQLMS